MSSPQQQLKTTVSILAVGYGLAALANLLLTISVGRGVGAAALGDFALAVAVCRVFYAGSDLGIPTHITRVVSRERERTSEYAGRFIAFRLAIIPIGVSVALASSFVLGRGHDMVFAIVGVALGGVTLLGLYEALLLAHDRQRSVGKFTVVGSVVIIGGCALWLVAGGDLLAFATMYATAVAVSAALWHWHTYKELDLAGGLRFDRNATYGDLKRCWPIGISALLGIGALRCSILILGHHATSSEVGAYAAVDTFVTAGAVLQVAMSNATFPRLARAFRTNPAEFRAVFWRSNLTLFGIGVVIAIGLATVGPPVIAFVFPTKDFAAIGEILPIMAWSTPGLLVVHHNVQVFAAADRERSNLLLMGLWFAMTAGFQLVLIPHNGVVGAAWGLLGARTVGLVAIIVAATLTGITKGE